MTDNASTSRYTRGMVWLFGQVRPALHNVLWVIYIGLSAVITAAAMVVVKRCFGEPARIDFLLLGHFFVSAAIGALLSAFVSGPPWLRATLFGAFSGLTMGLLTLLKHAPPLDASLVTGFTLLGAAAFPLIRWLSLKGY